MFEPKSAANSNWFFQKIFGEGDFIAAGEMVIPPEGKKPSKSSKDNAYVSSGISIDTVHLFIAFRCSMLSKVRCPSSSMKPHMSSPQAVCFLFPEVCAAASLA